MTRKYPFSWDLIGDIEEGRPNLGNTMRIEVYRLMQFTFRDVLEQELGADGADRLFYKSGLLAGKAFYAEFFKGITDPGEFIRTLQEKLLTFGIGVLRVEDMDLENHTFTLTVGEDLDCSGLPETDFEICIYDEGFIAGLLECFFNIPFTVKEVDCWCTGDRTCRFAAKPA